jgi:hypothetical protein
MTISDPPLQGEVKIYVDTITAIANRGVDGTRIFTTGGQEFILFNTSEEVDKAIEVALRKHWYAVRERTKNF